MKNLLFDPTESKYTRKIKELLLAGKLNSYIK
jgi:membrane carboxypeptidase/penicillin-binding protein